MQLLLAKYWNKHDYWTNITHNKIYWDIMKYSNLPVFGQFDLPHLPPLAFPGGGGRFCPLLASPAGGATLTNKNPGEQVPPLASICGRPWWWPHHKRAQQVVTKAHHSLVTQLHYHKQRTATPYFFVVSSDVVLAGCGVFPSYRSTDPFPQKEPTIRFIEHTFQNIIKRKK